MRDIHGHSEDRSTVYLVLRVFGIESESIGVDVYLDPELLRQSGQLVFTGETWSVTPGNGSAPVG